MNLSRPLSLIIALTATDAVAVECYTSSPPGAVPEATLITLSETSTVSSTFCGGSAGYTAVISLTSPFYAQLGINHQTAYGTGFDLVVIQEDSMLARKRRPGRDKVRHSKEQKAFLSSLVSGNFDLVVIQEGYILARKRVRRPGRDKVRYSKEQKAFLSSLFSGEFTTYCSDGISTGTFRFDWDFFGDPLYTDDDGYRQQNTWLPMPVYSLSATTGSETWMLEAPSYTVVANQPEWDYAYPALYGDDIYFYGYWGGGDFVENAFTPAFDLYSAAYSQYYLSAQVTRGDGVVCSLIGSGVLSIGGSVVDADGDGIPDAGDNCVSIPNSDQLNTDGDTSGDACDLCPNDAANDDDGDGFCADADACAGGDDRFDADFDGTPDDCDDCQFDANGDSDGDGACDSEDPCPADPIDDADADGSCDSDDICDGYDDFADADLDGMADGCDRCPEDAANDADGDGVCGNDVACDGGDDSIDIDADGTNDFCDACPFDFFNDTDGDGACDSQDACPLDNPNDPDADGVCTSDDICREGDDFADADGDSRPDACDICPDDAANDADGDGICGDLDNCASTANSNQADRDHDGIGDACEPDTDNDGVADDLDDCLSTANPSQADADLDGIGDACERDSDGDRVIDDTDLCPNTPSGAIVNATGCSITQLVPCGGNWKNHGAYVSAHSKAVDAFVASGLITAAQGGALQSAAAGSTCGNQ